jgi:hypothetical protein
VKEYLVITSIEDHNLVHHHDTLTIPLCNTHVDLIPSSRALEF